MIRLAELIPITRSIYAPETLSYFSTKKLSKGDLVKISLRGKDAFAVVQNVRDAKEEKAGLKKTSFKLKPIKSIVSENFLSGELFEAVDKISKTYFIPPSAILSALVPKSLLSAGIKSAASPRENGHKKLAIKGPFNDRMQDLRSIIREQFARKKSVMVLTPRIETLKKLGQKLGRGIEEYVFTFSSELSQKKYLAEYKRALTEEHPILILGTPQILFFDRGDLEAVVIEDEGSRMWRDKSFFSIDFRSVAEIIAVIKKIKLFYSDQLLRIETIYKSSLGEIEAKNTLTGRILNNIDSKIIKAQKSEEFSWISGQLEKELKEALDNNEKILLFVNRKGYSSFTICQDCSRSQMCPNCSVPLVLHGKPNERKFLCHHCLKAQEIPQYCQFCGSWKLKAYGLGIEKIEEEFRKIFPGRKYSILEKENEKSFDANDAATISTEAIFNFPDIKFDLVSIISIDYLFSIPDFRINETIFRLISELKNKASKKFILQTRTEKSALLQDAVAGNISSFYQDEIESRKNLEYPPFRKLVKLSKEDKNIRQLKDNEEKIMKYFEKYEPLSFPPFYEKIKGLYRWNILLRITEEKMEDSEFISKLENVSKSWQVSVDPESII